MGHTLRLAHLSVSAAFRDMAKHSQAQSSFLYEYSSFFNGLLREIWTVI